MRHSRRVHLALLVCAIGAATAGCEARRAVLPGATDSLSLSTPGNAVIQGNVVDLSGRPVPSGIVEILSGTSIVQTATVAIDGIFTVPSIAPGTYTLRLQPPLAYSLGPNEPETRSAVVTAGQTSGANVSFVVQPALYSDDFQGYTDVAHITGGTTFGTGKIPSGYFWAGSNHDMNVASAGQIVFDPTGGPNGSHAIRYDFPARPTLTSNYTVALQPRMNPAPSIGSSLYVRWTDMLSPGFRIGGAGVGGSGLEYKYLFIDLAPVGLPLGTFAIEFDSQTSAASDQFTLRTKIVDFVSQGMDSDPGNYRLGASLAGKWHTWVAEITGLGTPIATFRIWLDGVPIQTISGPFFPNRTIGGGSTVATFELGANINNGPDQAQSRWFREFGIYTTRPSMRPLVP